MNAYDAMTETVADHKVDEFYAWNDFKNDFRAVKQAGNEFLDGLDDFAADLDAGLDFLSDLADIEEDACNVDLSRSELRFHVWQ